MKLLVQIPEDNDFLRDYYSGAVNEGRHKGDAGINLITPEDVEIEPFEMKMVNLQIKTCLEGDNKETYSYFVMPRSSLSKTGLMMANSIGLIDAGYRGELKVPLIYVPHGYDKAIMINFWKMLLLILIIVATLLVNMIVDSRGSILYPFAVGILVYYTHITYTYLKSGYVIKPYKLKKGDRIVQLCSSSLQDNIGIEVVDTLPETERGTGGFGSTGR